MLANRLGAYQQAQQAAIGQRMNAQRALGPILAAPQATGPQYSVAQMLADSSNARPIATPGLNPAPAPVAPQVDQMAQAAQIAQALNPSAMPGAAGAAPATGPATAPSTEGLAPMVEAVKQFFTGNAPSMTGVPPQATSADAATAAAVLGNPGAAGATIGENIPQAPFTGVGEGPSPEAAQAAAAALGKPQDTMGSIGEWLSGLFSGGETPAAAPAPNTPIPAGAAPAKQAAPSAPAPTQGGLAELVTPSPKEGIAPIATQAYKGIPFITDPNTGLPVTPPTGPTAISTPAMQAVASANRQEQASKVGSAVSETLATVKPDLPKAEASAVKSVFENEDLYKMMIATGAALDSGMSYGEAMLAGSQAFLGSQAARAKSQKEDKSEVAAALQQEFDNQIELYKLSKGEKKEAAQVKLYEMQTKLAEAGIPLKEIEGKLKNAQIDLAKARTGAANRSNQGTGSGGKSLGGVAGRDLNDKDFAARVSQNRQNMAGNTVLGESANLDDDALAYTNSLLSPANRRYKTPTADVKKEVKDLLGSEQLTPEKLQRAQYLYNLYGDVPVEE